MSEIVAVTLYEPAAVGAVALGPYTVPPVPVYVTVTARPLGLVVTVTARGVPSYVCERSLNVAVAGACVTVSVPLTRVVRS